MQEEAAHPAEQGPVDHHGCPAHPRPRAGAVMRDRRVGVMKVGEHYCAAGQQGGSGSIE